MRKLQSKDSYTAMSPAGFQTTGSLATFHPDNPFVAYSAASAGAIANNGAMREGSGGSPRYLNAEIMDGSGLVVSGDNSVPVERIKSAEAEPDNSLANVLLRVKGRNILQVRRKEILPSINDSESSDLSYAGTNEAGINEPPIYYNKGQYNAQRRYALTTDSGLRRPDLQPLIKIVSPLAPTMVSKATSTEGLEIEAQKSIEAEKSESEKPNAPLPDIANLRVGGSLDTVDGFDSNFDVSVLDEVAPKPVEGSILTLSSSDNNSRQGSRNQSRKSKRDASKNLKPVENIFANKNGKNNVYFGDIFDELQMM